MAQIYGSTIGQLGNVMPFGGWPLQWSHFFPEKLLLHWHCPFSGLHSLETDPNPEQLQGLHVFHGTVGKLKNPGLHWSHFGPPMPFLQMHWPIW